MINLRIPLGSAIVAACVLAAAGARADDPKPLPLCKIGDAGVQMTATGWSGPDCNSVDAGGQQVGKTRYASKPEGKEMAKPKPLCNMGDRGVRNTLKGWEGPDCRTTDNFGHAVD